MIINKKNQKSRKFNTKLRIKKLQEQYKTTIKNTKGIQIKNSSNIVFLRNITNQTVKRIKNKIRKINEKEIEDIAKIIQYDNQSTVMFKAIKQIKNPTVENNIIVHNGKGETIINKINKYNAVKNYFKKNFGKKKMKE